ncbi:hypothetical protein [Kordia sp.]|uniref:hypothetical protein n=1 Tax=Kordia sp. TaxID=1965332 RepID=UPI0025C45421|nr:hypothetical protein [Kordia sp.]MCH2196040.1 hypothetical protein [Kordia sp.]
MKKITVFILASFLLICTHESSAQMTFGENGTFSNKWYEGELVLNNGETLKGLIKYESAMKSLGGAPAIMRKIFFKKTEKEKI